MSVTNEVLGTTFPIGENGARQQLFLDLKQAYNEQAKAGEDEIPDVFAAYMTLAIERFVRKAILKVSLPSDAAENLATALGNCFGNSCDVVTTVSAQAAEGEAAEGAEGSPTLQTETETVVMAPEPDALTAVVDALRVYTGIDSETVYKREPVGERPPGASAEIAGSNLPDTIEGLDDFKNGINFL